jgi:hypothetical protein
MAATHAGEHKHRKTQASMPPMGFEPMIQTFERANACRALDRAATVIGLILLLCIINKLILQYIFLGDRNKISSNTMDPSGLFATSLQTIELHLALHYE